MRIGVDGMGGDNAPAEIVKGVVEVSKLINDELYIFGDEIKIQKELNKYKYNKNQIIVSNAPEVIKSEEAPVKAVRTKTESSLVKGITAVKEQKIDVFVSAGSTGALIAGGLFILGRIPGIDRPAIATIFPPIAGDKPMLLADAGANSECKPFNLLEFGIMGSIYMEKVLGVNKPRIGLVNIGTEEIKGTTLTKAAYELLAQSNLNFLGNIEARDIPNGPVDVLVCDGFVGNVILKLTEGLATSLFQVIKRKITEDFISKVGAVILGGKFKDMKKMFDYSEHGGAPILGVKGAIIKMHGSSSSTAVKNAILKAIPYVENDVVKTIHDEILGIEENDK